jgi:ABC-type Fe3+ transport system permease subunit
VLLAFISAVGSSILPFALAGLMWRIDFWLRRTFAAPKTEAAE